VFARCPECQSTLTLSARELAHAGGVVSCGECDKVFNALANLFETPPLAGELPLSGTLGQEGMPPVLQGWQAPTQPNTPSVDDSAVTLDAALSDETPTALESGHEQAAAADTQTTVSTSATGGGDLELLDPFDMAGEYAGADVDPTADAFLLDQYESAQLAGAEMSEHGAPPFEGDQATADDDTATIDMGALGARQSSAMPVAVWWVIALSLLAGLAYQGWLLYEYQEHLKAIERLASQTHEPEAFRIISRDVHTHPSVKNAQLVSLRMLNTADYPQAFPVLEVSLLDTTQNVVAVRQFTAQEYLPVEIDALQLVEGQEEFPLVLQLSTPIGGHGGMTFRVL